MIKKLTTRALKLANYDFCPSFNPLVYWLKTPVGWVVGAIVFSLLVGMFIGPQGYVLATTFSALLIFGMIWPWLSMKGVQCELVLPESTLSEGEPAEILFKVQNFWPIPGFGYIVSGDFLQELDTDEEPIAFSLRRLGAWSESEFRIPITPRRRGQLPTGDVSISTAFPFGLFSVSKPLIAINRGLVWPARQSLNGKLATNSSARSINGSLCDRSGDDGEVIGVRCYRAGDRLRSIHWAQTVRCQQLMVRERQTLTSSIATVVVDLSPKNHLGHGVQSSYEWAIRVAASICANLNASESSVQLCVTGLPTEETMLSSNRAGIGPLMDLLASLPTLVEARSAQELKPNLKGMPFWGSGKRFFVGTDRSIELDDLPEEVSVFEISAQGFDTENDLEFFEPETETLIQQSYLGSGEQKVCLSSPELIADQLDAGWQGSLN